MQPPQMRAAVQRLVVGVACLAIALADPRVSAAQEPTPPALKLEAPPAGRVQRLTLRDGTQLVGRIVEVDSVSVKFESSLGVTTIAIGSIASVTDETPGQMRNGRYYFPNPNATRLVFAPTGRQLARGEGYFSDYWVFFPGIAVGVTDNFTIGGGMSIIPGIGLDEQIFYFTPKVGVVRRDRFNASVGALVIAVPGFGDGDGGSAGILYGVGTWGHPDASFTAGLGYGYQDGRMGNRPTIMLGADARIAPRFSLVTENYSIPGMAIFSGGLRFLARDLSVDLALATFADNDDAFCCFPFLGFVWKWE